MWLIFTPWIILISFLLAVHVCRLSTHPHVQPTIYLHTLMTLLLDSLPELWMPGGFNLKNRRPDVDNLTQFICQKQLQQNLSHDCLNDWKDVILFYSTYLFSSLSQNRVGRAFPKKNCLPVFSSFVSSGGELVEKKRSSVVSMCV